MVGRSVQLFNLMLEMQRTMDLSVSRCYPRSWNEDHISYTLLAAIKQMGGGQVVHDVPSFAVQWDAYKADGALEEGNGDIAVLVEFTYPNGAKREGVGFLEAKRIDGDAYRQLKWWQIELQNKNSIGYRVLLYDYEPIAVPSLSVWVQGRVEEGNIVAFTARATHSCVVLPEHVLALKTRTRALHSYSDSFAHQLVCRYILGYDLDYGPALVEEVKSGVSGGVQYLLAIGVAYQSEEVNVPRINSEYYVSLTSDDTK